jgi:hypothetical protein
VLGLAAASTGGVEIFVRAESILPSSILVRRHVKHDRWQGISGEFEASRIALPAEPHYQPVAAFIAEELLRNGLAESAPLAFARSEPIIEMALRRTAMSDELILGLIGELRVLNLLLSFCTERHQRLQVLESWTGFRRGARDFQAPGFSMEVKTTRSSSSVHWISGIHQVDPHRDANGNPTEALFLLSIGLEVAGEDDFVNGSITLPAIIEESLRLLAVAGSGRRSDAQQLLLDRVREYGGVSLGYDHDTMSTWPAYAQQFRQEFWRAYNMTDDRVEVIRVRDVQGCSAVSIDSIQFEVNLPAVVYGDLNPRTDLDQFAREAVARICAG